MGDNNTTYITDLGENGNKDLDVVTHNGKVAVGNMKGNNEAPAHEEDRGIEEEETPIHLSPLMQKTLSINLPLVEALLEMPGYAKFMKELVTKKRSLDFETIEVSHSCSAIMTNEMIKKKEDPGSFTIRCTIDMFQFAKALCDLRAGINLMTYAIYKQLGLGEIKSTTMRLLIIDGEIPIILGRPFLATGRALVDVESGELKFRVNED
ncbi:hypothetical protein R3W88_001060 [Solanum pinnatisectum]|uniref:Uncharacterized protein n=1 Tax=Solanum pinnatisectum TaxID=50273 RepID=A0AAV9MHC1_9SOLN|nr:hypothetical protein R3W88_001060 [Solanum pinnatisectum]